MIFILWFGGAVLWIMWIGKRLLVDVWLGIGLVIDFCFGFLQIPLYCIGLIVLCWNIIYLIVAAVIWLIFTVIFEWIPIISAGSRLAGFIGDLVGLILWTVFLLLYLPNGIIFVIYSIFYGIWTFIKLFFTVPAAIFRPPISHISLLGLASYLLLQPSFFAFIYELCSMIPSIIHIIMFIRYIAAYTSYATQSTTGITGIIISSILLFSNIFIIPSIWIIDVIKTIISVCIYLCGIPIETSIATFFALIFL
jgi:hypothetical protein